MKVLFVCIENSCRSQIAEGFARTLGLEAYSAGSRPSGSVNTRAAQFMREVGCDLSAHRSKSLSEIPDIEYDCAITMGCGDECPTVRAKRREDWNIPDPKNLSDAEFRAIRDVIEKKVRAIAGDSMQ